MGLNLRHLLECQEAGEWNYHQYRIVINWHIVFIFFAPIIRNLLAEFDLGANILHNPIIIQY